MNNTSFEEHITNMDNSTSTDVVLDNIEALLNNLAYYESDIDEYNNHKVRIRSLHDRNMFQSLVDRKLLFRLSTQIYLVPSCTIQIDHDGGIYFYKPTSYLNNNANSVSDSDIFEEEDTSLGAF